MHNFRGKKNTVSIPSWPVWTNRRLNYPLYGIHSRYVPIEICFPIWKGECISLLISRWQIFLFNATTRQCERQTCHLDKLQSRQDISPNKSSGSGTFTTFTIAPPSPIPPPWNEGWRNVDILSPNPPGLQSMTTRLTGTPWLERREERVAKNGSSWDCTMLSGSYSSAISMTERGLLPFDKAIKIQWYCPTNLQKNDNLVKFLSVAAPINEKLSIWNYRWEQYHILLGGSLTFPPLMQFELVSFGI
jgi:hypothetical protein